MADYAPEPIPELTFAQRHQAAALGLGDEPYMPTVDVPKGLGRDEVEAWWRLEWDRAVFWASVHGEATPEDERTRGLPTFPVHALPEGMRAVAVTIAENKCVSIDLAAVLLIAAVGLFAGPRVIIDRRKDWLEPLTEWTLTILDSGHRKTPAFDVVRDIILNIEYHLNDIHRDRLADDIRGMQDQIQGITDGDETLLLDGKGVVESIDELKAMIEELQTNPPAGPRLLIGASTTPEALEAGMARNNGCIGIFHDEAGAFDSVAGPYTAGVPTGLDIVLQAYSASRVEANERIKRETKMIPRAVLAYGITCQTEPIFASLRKQQLVDRGFHARWLYALPGPVVEVSDPPELDRRAIQRFTDTLTTLAEMPIIDATAERDKRKWPTLQLTNAALKLHRELQEEFKFRKMDGGDLAFMAPWANKYVGRVLRHAGLLHLAAGHGIDVAVSEDTMRGAIEIGEWALEHASELFRRAPKRPRGRDAEAMEMAAVGSHRVEKWILGTQSTHFTTRDVYAKVRKQSWCRSVADVDSALADLARDWVVRQVPRHSADGRALPRSPWWVANPDLVFGKAA